MRRVDGFESLPGVYKLVRAVVTPEQDSIFRAGSDLLLEQYLDGVEFDVDLVLQDGGCVFSSVSQTGRRLSPRSRKLACTSRRTTTRRPCASWSI